MDESDIRTLVERYFKAELVEQQQLLQDISNVIPVSIVEVGELLEGEDDVGYIVERLGLYEEDCERSYEQLIELVQKVMDGTGSRAQINEWLRVVSENVPMPDFIDLIYYPEEDEEDLTAKEIVDRALAYKPRVIHL